MHDGAGLLPGNAFVVRRGAEDGAVRWVFTCDHPATALDSDEDTVYVALNSGELVALSASDGTVRWRGSLEVHGRPVVALSLVRTGSAELLIGTVDGRILDCSIAAD
ncbi:PQQ-binding-like beta-propeller repeat protein [Streptomyces sp. HNM0645]|uniref:outer membrane protein assembly factor BamB family protein n=1 Tax=Streptomyces sp. HNM0645 TaxID=2782343 RepID=UPI0024B8167E|nr:PQQ-binding-like beta-propeller repeat protein [Streptomyces sp. HNM0645]MDI9887472.1 PQQ-binding-like beta-propeller repeat protein [Streptomyces sp. HNM0645]